MKMKGNDKGSLLLNKEIYKTQKILSQNDVKTISLPEGHASGHHFI